MHFDRRVIRGGILLGGAVAIAVTLVALFEEGGRSPQAWGAVAAALAVLAALGSAWTSQRVLELQEDALEPIIQVTFDFRSRYQLTQVRLVNQGASAAYDVRVEWDRPLITTLGKDVSFGPGGVLAVLAPKENASILLGQSHAFLDGNPDATWTGKVTYLNASGDHRSTSFTVTGEHERMALVHDREEPKTLYQLQQLPEHVEKIGSELESLRRVFEEAAHQAPVAQQAVASEQINEPITGAALPLSRIS